MPSLTELAIELGLADSIVARTGFCVHPAEVVNTIQKIGGTKDVNLAKLRRLAPTHVLVNVDENRLETIAAIRAWPNPPQIIVTHPLGPEDNLDLIAQLAEHFGAHHGTRARAARLSESVKDELGSTRPDGRASQQVLYLIWREPWMTVARDTYISRMLARINWQTLPDVIGGESGATRYPVLKGDESWLADVQRVLLSSEPYRFDEQHFDSARRLCPHANVQLVEGEMLSWYGSRAVHGLRYLREIAACA